MKRSDTRTTGAKLVTAVANLARLSIALVVISTMVAIPVGIVIVALHFIAKYW